MSSEEAAKKLAEKGIDITAPQLRKFKGELYQKLDREMRAEHMMENMLDSFDRTKIEFEDSVTRLKGWIEQLDKEGNTFQAMIANRDLMNQINIALKSLGKISDQITNVRANNINILNQTDFVDAFKAVEHSWFEKMDVRYEDGMLVFHSPSPELIDDYFRWSTIKLKKAIPVGQS